jgi:G3E family GTPase
MVTVVDAKTFLDLFGSHQTFSDKSELLLSDKDKSGAMEAQLDPHTGSGLRKITELLLEQVECADVVIINKIDLLESAAQLELVQRCISSINPQARVVNAVRGNVDQRQVIGSGKAQGAATWGMLDEHRNMVKAAEAEQALATHDHSHSSHEHTAACKEPKCTDPTHDHSHSSHEHTAACKEPKCTDPTHDHSHSSHEHTAACKEPKCTDPTHDHSHSSHEHTPSTTAKERFGITSFVYRRRLPFHPLRLTTFLQSLAKISVTRAAELLPPQNLESSPPKTTILRSKVSRNLT